MKKYAKPKASVNHQHFDRVSGKCFEWQLCYPFMVEMWSSTTCLLLNFSVCFPHWWETTVSLETNVSFSCRQAVWKAQNVETTSSKWNLRLANCRNLSRNHSLVFVPSLWHQPYIFDTESQESGKLNPQPVICKKHHKSMLTMCLSVITWPAVYDSQGQWLRQPH